jgi:hypothetical protein
MGLPIHDVMASTVNLARMIRDGLDPAQEMTPIRTATLKLLLDTLIDAGAPRHHNVVDDSARRSVAGMIAPPILDDRGGPIGRL